MVEHVLEETTGSCFTTFAKEIKYVTHGSYQASQENPEIEIWLFRKDLWKTHFSKASTPVNCSEDWQVENFLEQKWHFLDKKEQRWDAIKKE